MINKNLIDFTFLRDMSPKIKNENEIIAKDQLAYIAS